MKVRRGWARTLVPAIAALGVVVDVAPPAGAAGGMTLPGPVVTQLLVDPVHQHVFSGSGIDGDEVGVADYAAHQVTLLPIAGTVGMTLSPDGGSVYLAYARAGSPPRYGIAVVDAATLAIERRWTPPPGFCPEWLAVAGERLWMAGDCFDTPIGHVASTALDLTDFVETDVQTTDDARVASPGPDSNLVAVAEADVEPAFLGVYRVSGAALSAVATRDDYPGFIGELGFSPDGADLLINTSGDQSLPYAASRYHLPDITTPAANYPSSGAYDTAATFADGAGYVLVSDVAANEPGHVLYYRTSDPSGPVAQQDTTYVDPGTLAVTPDGSLVFTAEQDPYGEPSTLHVYPGPGTPVSRPSVTITSGPISNSYTDGSVTFNFTAANATATFCALDGDVRPCGSPVTFTGLADGKHTFTVTATNNLGDRSSQSRSWTVDTSAPRVRIGARGTRFSLRSAAFAWYRAVDEGSGVASYDVRYRSGWWDSEPSRWRRPAGWQHTAVTHVSLALAVGRTLCFSVRAHDRAGHTSAWSPSHCVARPLDDRALHRVTSGWAERYGRRYYRHTFTVTARRHARLARPAVVARRVALVVTRCPRCGRVTVRIAGRYVATVRLTARRWHNEVIVVLPRFGLRRGTIALTVVSTGRRVAIDGLGVTSA